MVTVRSVAGRGVIAAVPLQVAIMAPVTARKIAGVDRPVYGASPVAPQVRVASAGTLVSKLAGQQRQ